jgi:hypothetical protein
MEELGKHGSLNSTHVLNVGESYLLLHWEFLKNNNQHEF